MVRHNSSRKRQRRELERKVNQRASYDRILIVTEGSKTEPNYFKEIRRWYRLKTTNVVVCSSISGTSPMQVVNSAHDLFAKGDHSRSIEAKRFDRVYAVFDRDEHANFIDALKTAESYKGNLKNDDKEIVIFKAIVSVPCFELWLLLHFEDIKSPIERHETLSRLKAHLPDYKKNSQNLFEITKQNLEQASQRAAVLSQLKTEIDHRGPYTDVAELVSLLVNLHGG
ncbi:MAG: RloB family protein [Blastocatellia bacterium]